MLPMPQDQAIITWLVTLLMHVWPLSEPACNSASSSGRVRFFRLSILLKGTNSTGPTLVYQDEKQNCNQVCYILCYSTQAVVLAKLCLLGCIDSVSGIEKLLFSVQYTDITF